MVSKCCELGPIQAGNARGVLFGRDQEPNELRICPQPLSVPVGQLIAAENSERRAQGLPDCSEPESFSQTYGIAEFERIGGVIRGEMSRILKRKRREEEHAVGYVHGTEMFFLGYSVLTRTCQLLAAVRHRKIRVTRLEMWKS